MSDEKNKEPAPVQPVQSLSTKPVPRSALTEMRDHEITLNHAIEKREKKPEAKSERKKQDE